MIYLLASLFWAAIVAWLIKRAIVQGRHFLPLPPASRSTEPPPTVAVIVPARNEADKIERCLAGLAAQSYRRGRLAVVVVDDASTDATPSLVEHRAAQLSNLRLLKGRPLPPGWLGKSYACWQAAETAESEWLCFVDADTFAAPELVATAVAAAQRERLDMISLEPFQELGSFWERLVLPTGFLLLAFFKDRRRFDDPESQAATANGQFLLIRRAVYQAIGGHRAVRGDIVEDKRLAQRAKRAGYRVATFDGQGLIRTRMYTGLGPLWEGLSKHAAELADGPAHLLLYAVAGVALGIAGLVLPGWGLAQLAAGHRGVETVLATAVALAGTGALLAIHLGTVRHLRVPLGYGFLAPLGYSMVLLIAAHCLVQRMTGRTAWKGRVYELPAHPERRGARSPDQSVHETG